MDVVELRPGVVIASNDTGIPGYDFDFSTHLQLKHPHDLSGRAVIFRCGAIADYAVLEHFCTKSGSHPLLSRTDHLLASRLDLWYERISNHTIKTMVYREFPNYDEVVGILGQTLFIKGVRQTDRHNPALSKVTGRSDYERIREQYAHSAILHWQDIAIRQWVPIRKKDNGHGEEYRSFWFAGECIGLGSYWDAEPPAAETRDRIHVLGKTIVELIGLTLIVVDFAVLQDGRLVVIECNDAQESGYSGISPRQLWSRLMTTDSYRTLPPPE
jgi:hypothetical protein